MKTVTSVSYNSQFVRSALSGLLFVLFCFVSSSGLMAQCTITVDGGGAGGITSTTSKGQSFKATCTGTLNTISVIGKAASSGHSVTVYSGAGSGGTQLGQLTGQSIALEAGSLTNFSTTFDFSGEGISLTSGSTYTFVISGIIKLFLHDTPSSAYADGILYFNGGAQSGFDLNFKVDIAAAATPPCGTNFTVDFESETWTNNQQVGTSINSSGIVFSYFSSGSTPKQMLATVGTSGPNGNVGLAVNNVGGIGDTFEIKSSDGCDFDFKSFYTYTSFVTSVTLTGYRDGTQVAQTTSFSIQGNGTNSVSSAHSDFQNVDRVVLSNPNSGGFGFFNGFDDIAFGPAVVRPVLTAYIADSSNDAIYKVDLNSKSSVTAADQIISGATVSNAVRDLWLDEISATKKLYFGHNDGTADIIKRANTDGTSIENVITGISGIRAIAYDASETMLYWFDDVSDLLYRADISSIPVAQTSAESVAVIVGTQGNNIRDIELEISGTDITIYTVATNNNESIFKTTIDRDQSGALSGATWSTLVTELTLSSYLALDLNNNFLYFTDDQGAGVGNVYRISTSASSTAVGSLTAWSTVAANAPDPLGIDVDLINNEVYFSTTGSSDDLRKGSLGATSGTISTALTGFSVIEEIEIEVGNPVEVSDATPPVFESSTPSASSIAQTGFTLATDIDEGGTIYYVVVADGATAPTSANVKAAQSSGAGTPVTSGNTAVSSGGFSNNFSVTGLTASTAYDVYVVAQDGTPNLQTSPTKIDVTTSAPSSLSVAATVFLEGAYNGTGLNTTINTSIPTTQPYSNNGHSGGTAGSIPAGAVDWVLVELREAGSAAAALNSTKRGSAAGFLMSDGTIKATDGTSNLTVSLSSNIGTDYYVVIYHRNHLSIMSANAVTGSSGTLTIDFTSSSATTFQTTTALVSLSGGKFGMPAGDTNDSGTIDATDLSTWSTNNGLVYNYSGNGVSDFNLDGVINAVDRNDFHQKNTGKTRQVPST